MKGFSVLIVEDDMMIRNSLKRFLEFKGFNVVINDTGENVIEQLDDIHLILMDIMLPHNNGFSITEEIRESYHLPIIFMSARNDIDTKLQGLQTGEDYITKPFNPLELEARMNNLLNQFYDEDLKDFHHLSIDEVNKLVYDHQNNLITFTKKEHDLFFYLYENQNNIVSKEQIINFVWSESEIFDNILNVYIKRIRDKIGDHEYKIIKTIYGIGYRVIKSEK
ncbi:response regulator transcription factor [Macrococcus equipercicus]|nr:response regulator transcription factor [Macrococcus equipercicus]